MQYLDLGINRVAQQLHVLGPFLSRLYEENRTETYAFRINGIKSDRAEVFTKHDYYKVIATAA